MEPDRRDGVLMSGAGVLWLNEIECKTPDLFSSLEIVAMTTHVLLFMSLLVLTGCSSTSSRVSPTIMTPERLEAPRIDASRVGIILIDA